MPYNSTVNLTDWHLNEARFLRVLSRMMAVSERLQNFPQKDKPQPQEDLAPQDRTLPPLQRHPLRFTRRLPLALPAQGVPGLEPLLLPLPRPARSHRQGNRPVPSGAGPEKIGVRRPGICWKGRPKVTEAAQSEEEILRWAAQD